jgi:uncharacterized SAM-binding protein YcdF (DUF218 family)
MRRLFGFVFQLATGCLGFVAITVVWIVFDGLNDEGEHADVALVAGHGEDPGARRAWLDRVARLYKDGEFPRIIVSAASSGGAYDEQTAITGYLEQRGVPSSAIIDDTGAANLGEMARDVADIMQTRELHSIMIVTDYYRTTRLKLALLHAGISDIKKTHVGTVRKEDAVPILQEVVALYEFVGRTFLLPAAKKIKEEAATEADKAKIQAEKAKDNVNKGLDSLPK